MENLTSTLILDNKKGIRININIPLNKYNDIENFYNYYENYIDDIYDICRQAYFSGNYEAEITLIGHNGKNIGSKLFNIPILNEIRYTNDITIFHNLYEKIYKTMVDLLNFKYILCVGNEIIILNREDLSRYESNIKEIYTLKSFCRKLACENDVIAKIKEKYPDAKLIKFNYFNHKEV